MNRDCAVGFVFVVRYCMHGYNLVSFNIIHHYQKLFQSSKRSEFSTLQWTANNIWSFLFASYVLILLLKNLEM